MLRLAQSPVQSPVTAKMGAYGRPQASPVITPTSVARSAPLVMAIDNVTKKAAITPKENPKKPCVFSA